MKKLILAISSILAFPVLAQPTAIVPSATTTTTSVPFSQGTETTTTTTTVSGAKQAMEEAPVEKNLSQKSDSESFTPSLQQRQEKSPNFNLNPEREEDEYVPGNNYLKFEESDEDEY